MNNQEFRTRPKINVNSNEPSLSFIILTVLKKINEVVVVIILMILMQNYVFLMLLKT